jgi:general secretion pathway protein L
VQRVLPHLLSSDVSDLAAAAFRWWVGQLRSLVPQRLMALLPEATGEIVLEIQEVDISIGRVSRGRQYHVGRVSLAAIAAAAPRDDVATRVQRLGRGAKGVVVGLHPDRVLRKTIRLPLAAARTLRPILRNEIDRQVPLDLDRIYFDYRIVSKDRQANVLTVDVGVAKRETVQQAARIVRWLGLEPTEVTLFESDAPGRRFNFLPLTDASASARAERLAVPALSALALLLSVAVVLAWIFDHGKTADAYAAEIGRAKAGAQAAEKVQGEVQSLVRQLELLPRQKQDPSVAKVLSEVSRILPDATWLFQLELSGREVRMRGYSSAAPGLIGLLDASPLFTNAQFRAPLTQGPWSGLERFDLSVEIREPPT